MEYNPMADLEDVPISMDPQELKGFDSLQVEFHPGPNGKAIHASRTPYDSLMVDKL